VVVLAAAAAVSVAVCAVALLKVSEDEEKLHVGILLAPEGDLLIPQVSVTVPVNALPGVTVMVAVLVDPGLTVIAPPLESEKPAVLPLLGACQKSPQPARTPADKQTATGAATAINRRAHHPILIAAPFRSPSEPVHPGPRRLPYPSWVPHPRRVLVSAARVGYLRAQIIETAKMPEIAFRTRPSRASAPSVSPPSGLSPFRGPFQGYRFGAGPVPYRDRAHAPGPQLPG